MEMRSTRSYLDNIWLPLYITIGYLIPRIDAVNPRSHTKLHNYFGEAAKQNLATSL